MRKSRVCHAAAGPVPLRRLAPPPCCRYLDVFAVVASGRQLYPSEGDRTFEGNLDGRLLHAVLAVQRRVARRCRYAAEVPLY